MVSYRFCHCQTGMSVFRNYKVKSLQAGNSPDNSIPSSSSVTEKLHLMPIMVYFIAFGGRWQRRGDLWSHTVPADRGVLRRHVLL